MIKTTKAFIAILLFITTSIQLSAQEVKDYTGSLVWKVSGKDLTQPSYILGTHHLIEKNFLDSINGFSEAFANTQQIAGELDMSNISEIQAKIQAVAMMPQDTTYQMLLNEIDYAALETNLTGFFGAGLNQLGNLRPAMLSNLYVVVLYQKIFSEYNPQTHILIDEHIQNKGRAENKRIIGLETADDQIYALFYSTPLDVQAQSLTCATGLSLDYYKEQLTDMNNKYMAGDLVGLYDLAYNDPNPVCPIDEVYKAALLKNRNDNWLVQMPQIMKTTSTLFAVGALHLAGEEGLLYQLDKMGYKIEAVK